MLPVERQQQLLSWLEEEGTLRVSEISSRLEVSEMTIYRDIKPLIEENKITKTSKGIAIASTAPAIAANRCTYCFKTVETRHNVHLIMNDQSVEQACCAHCGLLRYEAVSDRVSQIICTDFLLGTTISAKTAVYLMDSEIDIQCCKPQLLAFDSKDRALRFQKGFGGELYSFNEVIRVLSQNMNEVCCSKQTK
ncbi:DeoR family transcriptional regulator [Ornithinibacillus contaminans]|uniref:DeoR family transcriptional regulator n=1 Tax=Ornithinibacillus contaminans TaxID=694055 RepID=UPI00064DC932|nr:DeoR family transcriptional regulator [Ornithinibacillus contaminans]